MRARDAHEPIAIVGMAAASRAARTTRTRSGSCCATACDAIARGAARIAGTSTPTTTPTRTRPGRCTRAAAASSTASTGSTRTSSASRRARRASMDPQQRLLLEVRWEALEARRPSRRTRCAGTPHRRVRRHQQRPTTRSCCDAATRRRIDAYIGDRQRRSASRRAGSRTCSACRARAWRSTPPARRRSSRCTWPARACAAASATLALAGGVNVMLAPDADDRVCRGRACWRADGRCKTFDAAADGYVRGEGCGVVVLKRLSRRASRTAIAILAVIRGSAVNQDGRSSGLTVPNGPAQQAVIREALAQRGRRAARGRLRRGARHRHVARRSDRGARARRGARRKRPAGSAAARRIGQDQHRPPRSRRPASPG